MSEAVQLDASAEQPTEDSAQDQQLPDKIQIDGEEINLQDAIADHRNRRDWQKAQTQRDQEIAAQRKEVNELLSKVIDQVGPNNQQAAQQVAQNVANDFDVESRIEAMPDPIEDEKGYKQAMAGLLKEYGDAIKSEVQQTATSLKSETQQEIANQSQKDRIVQDNLRMVRDYVANKFGDSISTAETDEVIRRVGQKWGPEYGSEDTSGAFRFNENAVEESIWQVPSLRTQLIASQTNEARKEGLTGRQAGQQALSPTNRAASRPGQNAPIGDKIDWLRGLSEPEMHRAVGNMNADERNQMLKSLYDQG